MSYLKRAREVFDVELAAVKSVQGRLNRSFDQAVDLIAGALLERRKLVVVGVGKSGNIGKKKNCCHFYQYRCSSCVIG